MMEGKSRESSGTESNAQNDGGKAEITPAIRRRVLGQIVESLKAKLASSGPRALDHICKVAKKFEEKMYRTAKTKESYLQEVCRKLYKRDKPINHSSDSPFSAPDHTQPSGEDATGHTLNLHNVDGHSAKTFGGSSGRDIKSESFSCEPKEISRSQPIQQFNHQVYQNHQPVVSYPAHVEHVQQHLTSQPTQFSREPHVQQPKARVYKWNHQRGLQSNLPDQQELSCQENIPNLRVNPQSPQTDTSQVQEMQDKDEMEAGVLNVQKMPLHLASSGQRVDNPALDLQKQNPVQLHTSTGNGVNACLVQENMPKLFSTPARTNQSQVVLPDTPKAPMASSSAEVGNISDWHVKAYQQIQSLRINFLSDLRMLYRRARVLISQASDPEKIKNYKNYMILFGKLLKFLELSQDDLKCYSRESFDFFERTIVEYMRKRTVSGEQNRQKLFSHDIHPTRSQLSQNRSAKLESSPMNFPLPKTMVTSFSSSPSAQRILDSQAIMTSCLHSGLKTGTEQKLAKSSRHLSFSRTVGPCDGRITQKEHLLNTTSANKIESTMNLLSQFGNIIPLQQQKQSLTQQEKHLQDKREHIQSPQMRQRGGSQINVYSQQKSLSASACTEQKNLLSSSANDCTSLLSVSSTYNSAFPSTSSMPSSVFIKDPIFISGPSENHGDPRASVTLVDEHTEVQSQTNAGTSRTSCPPIFMEDTDTNVNQQLNDMQRPIDQLIKVVGSMSPEALSASVHDIASVVNFVDMPPKAAVHIGPGERINEHLALKNKQHSQSESWGGFATRKKMKRDISATAFHWISSTGNESSSLNYCTNGTHEINLTTMSAPKRHRVEYHEDLLKEIQGINQRLMETVLELDTRDEAVKGTIVRCSYSPVGLGKNPSLWTESSQKPLVLSLSLLVPEDIATISPVVLDKVYAHSSVNNIEAEDLTAKAKSRFHISLRKLSQSQPISLQQMAEAWNNSARTVFLEFAELCGGGCQATKYGSWENCANAD